MSNAHSDARPVVVVAGLSDDLREDLSRRLAGASVRVAGDQVLQQLEAAEASLLILDHDATQPSALDLLVQIRATAKLCSLPVLYCLSPGPAAALLGKLVEDLGVQEIMFHPVDAEELARRACDILGLPPPTPDASPAGVAIGAAVANLWEKARAAKLESLEILDQAGVALLEGKCTTAARQAAEREAHKLAGSLAFFGFPSASRFAQEMESMLGAGTRLSELQALRFSELAVALRLELENAPHPGSAPSGAPARGAGETGHEASILVADPDVDFAARLVEEGANHGLRVEAVDSPAAARAFLSSSAGPTGATGNRPELVLLALDAAPPRPETSAQPQAEGWRLLAELGDMQPPVPAMVITGSGALTDRVEVARRGGRGFLSKSLGPSEILDAVVAFLARQRSDCARVLAVDDDPGVLGFLKALLEPHGIALTPLADPLGFWEAMESSAPDLVILDINMPHLSGIELCRVLRSDPRRAALPVLFLTGLTDAETVHRVFAAGADDYVAKPVVGLELVTRVLNRLERARLIRSFAESDPVTGVANRRKFSRALDDFLRLARRHGEPLALAVLELEGVQELNARYGHALGDESLRHLGRLLSRAFRSEDTVGRWGGSEFVIGMYGMSRYNGIERMTELLAEWRARPLPAPDETEIHLSFSAGVAEYPSDGGDLASLYAAAASACRQATAQGSSGGGRVLAAGWNPQGRDALRRVDVVLATGDEAEALLLLHALESQGCRVRALGDGQSALRLLGGVDPALRCKVLFLDVDLPGLDGLSLLQRLAADGVLAETRVVVLTTPTTGDDAPAALAIGAVDHVAKPFSLPVAVQRIRRALESAGPLRVPSGGDALPATREDH